MITNDLERTAVHEAGHAIVADHFLLGVEGVYLVDERTRKGYCSAIAAADATPEIRVAWAAAGGLAVALIDNQSAIDWLDCAYAIDLRLIAQDVGGDASDARTIVASELFKTGSRIAWAVLSSKRQAIVDLADRLQVFGALSGREVNTAIADSESSQQSRRYEAQVAWRRGAGLALAQANMRAWKAAGRPGDGNDSNLEPWNGWWVTLPTGKAKQVFKPPFDLAAVYRSTQTGAQRQEIAS